MRPFLRSLVLCALVVAVPAIAATRAPARRAASSGRVAAAHPRPALPFIEDDWTRAIALAKQRRLPLFVEAWAPW